MPAPPSPEVVDKPRRPSTRSRPAEELGAGILYARGDTPRDTRDVRVLAADTSTYSTVITCALCPSWRIVRATRADAWREARRHASTHGPAVAKQAYNATRARGARP